MLFPIGEFFGCQSWSNDANNFNSVDECAAICGVDSPGQGNGNGNGNGNNNNNNNNGGGGSQQQGQECTMTPSASTFCNSPTIRYFFDRQLKQCSSFYGCALQGAGPANNFQTLAQCQSKCQGSSSPTGSNRFNGIYYVSN